MANTPHELHEEFPALAEKITALKGSDAHFAKLHSAYHEVNRAIHRAETNVEPIDQFAEETMRKERAKLKDEIYGLLTAE